MSHLIGATHQSTLHSHFLLPFFMSQQLAQDIRSFALRNNQTLSGTIEKLGLSNSILYHWTKWNVTARPATESRVRRLMARMDRNPENRLIPSLVAVAFCGIACFLLGYFVAVTF